jgi:hypothetical protein
MIPEDGVVAFVITMFILSQISERICNLLKLNLHNKYLINIYFYKKWFQGNLQFKEEDPQKEKIREKKILLISLIAGSLTTFLFFIFLFGSNFYIDELRYLKYTSYLSRGFLFIGMSFFLSFGAKFWHDILDILLAYKNIKRKLADSDTYLIEGTEELQQKISLTDRILITDAFEKVQKDYATMEGIVAIAIGRTEQKQYCINIHIEDKRFLSKFRKEVIVIDGLGRAHHIPIEIIVTGIARAAYAQVGGEIYNGANKDRTGTLGYIVYNSANQPHLLSCYHVLRADVHNWSYFGREDQEDIFIRTNSGEQIVGELTYGFRNQLGDLGIAKIKKDILYEIQDEKLKSLKIGDVNNSSIGTKVSIKGMTQVKEGIIWESSVEVDMHYPSDKTKEKFINFFSITKSGEGGRYQSPTVEGDSGAIIFNGAKEALGIVVGISDKFTYAMKLDVLQKCGFNIIKKLPA